MSHLTKLTIRPRLSRFVYITLVKKPRSPVNPMTSGLVYQWWDCGLGGLSGQKRTGCIWVVNITDSFPAFQSQYRKDRKDRTQAVLRLQQTSKAAAPTS